MVQLLNWYIILCSVFNATYIVTIIYGNLEKVFKRITLQHGIGLEADMITLRLIIPLEAWGV